MRHRISDRDDARGVEAAPAVALLQVSKKISPNPGEVWGWGRR
jgi:hypothetical protein